MAVPGPEVLENLDQLITAVTGFTNNQENFEPCRRYCLSHFVHHVYASVNKSTVRKTIDDLENRFYTHGHFNLSRALRTQVDQFLSHEDTFKANPECQIEWGLLSLVTSLARNLSSLHNVPPLLPVTDDAETKDEFDWGSYLKEGLPVYNYDTDSDSFSSLSTDEEKSNVKSTDLSLSNIEPCQVNPPEEVEDLTDNLSARKLFLDQVQERCRDYLADDLAQKKNFATKWQNLKSPSDPFFLVSEKDSVEIILNSLMTGENLDGLRHASICSLSKETFQGCIDSFKPYLEGIKSINEYIKFVETFEETPVLVKVYASCLRKALLRYELKLLDVSKENPSLMLLLEMTKPCFPYILGLSTVHNICVVSASKNEPSWQTSLRILTGLYNSMITNHNPVLQSLLVGIFLQCHAVYGRIIDALLTSASPTDPYNEFYISREISEEEVSASVYIMQPCENPLPFVEIVSKQVIESRDSLSVLYTMNRFPHLNNESFVSINKTVFETLKGNFHSMVDSENTQETDLFKEVSILEQNDSGEDFDFSQVTRWLDNSESLIPIYKIFEMALHDAVENQLNVVRNSAMTILINEMSLPKHFSLLRSVYLCHDASLLLPFLQIFFKEENSWANADYLTTLLRECIATNFPNFAGNVSVVIGMAEGQVPQNIVQAIDSLEISYQVPYPISLVLTPAILSKYNAIHRTLLKLKWAHTLSYLRFPDKKSTPQPAARCVMHRLQVLRFSCLADLQVISNYFIAQVTASMPKNCENYSDIRAVIQDHEQLIERIHSRCMLSEGDQHYTLIFGAIIPLVVDLRRCWMLEEANIISKLKLMESIYKGTHAKLRRLMSYLEKETYVPLVAKLKEESLSATHQAYTSKFTSFG